MKKSLLLTLTAIISAFISFAQPYITGPSATCVGSAITLHDTTFMLGPWSSSNPAVATVSGWGPYCSVYGVSVGTTVITFSPSGGGMATHTLTVGPGMTVNSGPTTVCEGSTITLSNPTPGGVWSTDSPIGATVDPATGVVTGVSMGSTHITYTLGVCNSISAVTTLATPINLIIGDTAICVGGTQTFSNYVSGGTWTSSNPSIATIDLVSGMATGVTAGAAVVSYHVTGICGPAFETANVSVSSGTAAVPIVGPSSMTLGSMISLSPSSAGVWASSNTNVATVNGAGVVTAVSVGTTVIGLTVTGCSGPATSTHPLSVGILDGISGYITGGPICGAPLKVWLIAFDPSSMILHAVDSTYAVCHGWNAYYEFTGLPTDSFRVKAAYDTTSATSYIPTYHTSSFYWHSADVIYHTSGTADINKNIGMLSGASTSGPGFIGGSVLTGANKGTTAGDPVTGLRMHLLDATNQIVSSTLTNTSGNYSFTNLPAGTYTVFPDSLNYLTTPYSSITLTTGSPSMNVASFRQNPLAGTIIPIPAGVDEANVERSVTISPNPAGSMLNLQWTTGTANTAAVVITDIMGREVAHRVIEQAAGTAIHTIDVTSFINGIYVISLRSASGVYTTTVEIRH